MRKVLKQHLNEIFVLLSLLIIAGVLLLTRGCNNTASSLRADVYLRNEIVMTFDLSKEKEDESRLLSLQGSESEMIIEVKKNAIRVHSSSCPHQDCVNQGWVTTTDKPIICAYNSVLIKLVGISSNYDIVI